jgi:2-polyprenyl-6-methoxyphenol hydroxylase-like FAD-dependent oxidoreductase
MAHRAHLHTQLKNAATSPAQPGRPVKLNTSSKVITVDPETATIHLEDGSSHSSDVVIGADGVHSNARKALMDNAPEPVKGAHNCFRFILPREVTLDDPEIKQLVEEYNSMDMWYLEDKKIVMYSTSNNKLLNFVCIHPEHLTGVSDDYTKSASKPQMLEIFKEFHPTIVKLLDKVDPADLKIYPLYHMAVLPTFVSGRMALVGDAAHPFTPHLAQGGAMAIEDGAALGVMLGDGALPENVPERLQLYNKARYERATNIQQFSLEVGRDAVASKPGEASRMKGKVNVPFSRDMLNGKGANISYYSE